MAIKSGKRRSHAGIDIAFNLPFAFFSVFGERFLRRLEHSIKERGKRKDSILTSDSYPEDDAVDSFCSDAATSSQAAATDQIESNVKVSNATASAPSIVTKSKRSLSLHTQHEIRKVVVDSFYEDEATSD